MFLHIYFTATYFDPEYFGPEDGSTPKRGAWPGNVGFKLYDRREDDEPVVEAERLDLAETAKKVGIVLRGEVSVEPKAPRVAPATDAEASIEFLESVVNNALAGIADRNAVTSRRKPLPGEEASEDILSDDEVMALMAIID